MIHTEHIEGDGGDSNASANKPSARQAFEDCPLIEIVHFHECLRGELRSLQTNVEALCRQMQRLHDDTSAGSAATARATTTTTLLPPPPPPPHEEKDGGRSSHAAGVRGTTAAAAAAVAARRDGSTAGSPLLSLSSASPSSSCSSSSSFSCETPAGGEQVSSTLAAPAAAGDSFPREHLELEVQVQSQFQLLWAVFQSHSTAEDEVIWPALKEKARSSGGKLKLVNHDDGPHVVAAAAAAPRAGAGAAGAMSRETERPDTSPEQGGRAGKLAVNGEANSLEDERGSLLSSPLDAGMPTAVSVPAEPQETGRQGMAVVGGDGDDHGDGGGEGQYGAAMIDEAEYTEEHHEEQRLFEDMQKLLTGLRNTRHSSVPERMQVVTRLGRKTEEMCRNLMTHLDKEEESALPLIKHYFTGPEMGALVGKIMGKRPTELMQTILSMMIKNLPAEEVHTVMGYMRHAVKDTYFEKWLASGGFQWPTNAPNNKKEGAGARKNGAAVRGNGAGAAANRRSGGTSSAGSSHSPFHPVASQAPGGKSSTAAAAAAAAASTNRRSSASRSPDPYEGQRRGSGGGVKRQGSPLGRSHGMSSSSEAAVAAAGGGGVRDRCCQLDEEFGGMSLDSGSRISAHSHPASTSEARACGGGGGGSGGHGGDGDGGHRGVGSLAPISGHDASEKKCTVCSYIGRCPVDQPMTQEEFETAVKRLSHVSGLSTERKSSLVQMMRNHMYQGRKRPRPETAEASSPPSSFSAGGAWPPLPVARMGTTAGGGGGTALAAPARHYTSTQPDIEDASGGDYSGGGGGELAALPPALFTREELAPTYHVAPGGGAANGASWEGGHPPPTDCEGSPAGGGEGGGGGGGAAGEVVLGCPHYQRACKIRAPCCQKLFTCRLCHDQASDHTVDREKVTEMLCMRCGTLQPVHSECRNPSCRPTDAEGKPPDTGQKMARYYCGICHLFDDAPDKDIYHCPYCNMCRLGKGLGVDFFHCMTCNACVSSKTPDHPCLSKSVESDCPICSTSIFTSTSQVKGLRCGHFMHLACYKEYVGRAESREFWYRCPVCRKSMEDMREYFSQMDAVVASQPMPEEYAGWKTKVLCHDCECYSEVPYHFYYLKCGACGSYNTRTEGKTLRDEASGASTPAPPAQTSHPPPLPAALRGITSAREDDVDGESAPPGP